ncbi:hypothetical protein ACLOJK_018854, partial [Asimina triloba]
PLLARIADDGGAIWRWSALMGRCISIAVDGFQNPMDDMLLDAWEEARFDVRFGAMKVDAGRRLVRFWGCHAIVDLQKTLMDGSGSTGWKEKSGPEMDGGRTAGRDLDESDIDRDPAAILCRRDLPSLLLPIPAIELPLKKSIKVASWLAGSVAVDATRCGLGLSVMRIGDAIDCCLIC